TCAACATLVSKMLESAGSMASQMRCVAMLENVASDSKKAERWVAAEIRGGAEGMSKFQIWQLQSAVRPF
ncbi:MAG: hypothetical protein KAY15_02710, partial [Polaromonas sp.]|nr:hypothetical protein [Polaromonas sp.]